MMRKRRDLQRPDGRIMIMSSAAFPSARGVARVWRGATLPKNAEHYGAYLYEYGVRKLESLGARGVQMFREDQAERSEFMVISYWDSMEAMVSWAGSDPSAIRHLERDQELLIALPDKVQILEVWSSNSFLAGKFSAA
jgi:heme-degrading monooxygenase HmoA